MGTAVRGDYHPETGPARHLPENATRHLVPTGLMLRKGHLQEPSLQRPSTQLTSGTRDSSVPTKLVAEGGEDPVARVCGVLGGEPGLKGSRKNRHRKPKFNPCL